MQTSLTCSHPWIVYSLLMGFHNDMFSSNEDEAECVAEHLAPGSMATSTDPMQSRAQGPHSEVEDAAGPATSADEVLVAVNKKLECPPKVKGE